ncbi:hypothetical protein [Limimaricola sp.]|uniref:hypothetical protein n=1 Tax=Limimaricola sp. TaxID=2211665 RepID=UPI0025C4C876|nr:hypothetical protein [Limimaricola sp.]
MNLHAPSQVIFLISLVLAALALLSALGVKLPGNNAHAIWVALAAYVLLTIGMLA